MTASQAAYADYQSLLYPIAVKMLGNPQDAEDLVQETLLKWLSMEHRSIENAKGYLVRTLINKCLNFIRDHRKESDYEITPELLIDLPPSRIEHTHLLSASFRMLFEKLNPIERAVFLLKEVFHYAHKEIAELLAIKEAHCRQILSRAKRRLKDEKVRFEVGRQEHEVLYQKFMEVCQGDNLTELLQLLQLDIAHYRHEASNDLPSIKGEAAVMAHLREHLWPYRHLLRYQLQKKAGVYTIHIHFVESPIGHLHIYPQQDQHYRMDFYPYLPLKDLVPPPTVSANPS